MWSVALVNLYLALLIFSAFTLSLILVINDGNTIAATTPMIAKVIKSSAKVNALKNSKPRVSGGGQSQRYYNVCAK